MKLPSSITLCEVGLRDGLQNEVTLLTVHQKIALLLGLIDAGFKVIEVGSFMHPKAVPQMANTDEVYKAIGEIPDVELRALIPNLRGITRAIDCGCKKVKLNVSASRMHNLKNLNMTPEQSVAGFASSMETVMHVFIASAGVFVTCMFPIHQFLYLFSTSHGLFSIPLRHTQNLSLPKTSSGKCSNRTGCSLPS